LISEVNALKNKFDMEVIRHRTFEDAKASQSGYDVDSMNMESHHAGMDVDF
jgi:DNA-directed RNA polymerase II subunit RPB11